MNGVWGDNPELASSAALQDIPALFTNFFKASDEVGHSAFSLQEEFCAEQAVLQSSFGPPIVHDVVAVVDER